MVQCDNKLVLRQIIERKSILRSALGTSITWFYGKNCKISKKSQLKTNRYNEKCVVTWITQTSDGQFMHR